MTAPREHAELAILYFSDSALRCWVREIGRNDEWGLMCHPSFNSPDLEYYVGHEPPPTRRSITLTVNGREWVLPEPLREEPEVGSAYWIVNNAENSGTMSLHWDSHTSERLALKHATIHATAADAQAWAEFDRWCRGGGHD